MIITGTLENPVIKPEVKIEPVVDSDDRPRRRHRRHKSKAKPVLIDVNDKNLVIIPKETNIDKTEDIQRRLEILNKDILDLTELKEEIEEQDKKIEKKIQEIEKVQQEQEIRLSLIETIINWFKSLFS